ncbi:MAG: 30S ribosomal protein S16 [bacterium]
MLTIRLRRVGKKKKPTFRIIVSEKAKDTLGDFLEMLGSYDPHTNPSTIIVKADRVKHWINKGAQCSDTVHNILVTAKVVDDKKIPQGRAKKKKSDDKENKPEAKADQPADQATEKTEEKPEAKPEPETEAKPEVKGEKPAEEKVEGKKQ